MEEGRAALGTAQRQSFLQMKIISCSTAVEYENTSVILKLFDCSFCCPSVSNAAEFRGGKIQIYVVRRVPMEERERERE